MTNIQLTDPQIFAEVAIDEETNAFNHQIEQDLSELPPLWETGPVAARQAREEGKSIFGPLVLSPRATTRKITTSEDREIGLRIFLPPENAKAVYFHIHGGGWVLGGNHHQDPRLEALSRSCQLAVISVDYRLSPEHPYPAAPDDCELALLWLLDHSESEFGSERILIGGESAGAHLSVVTMLRMRDRHAYTGFAGANLVYGIYDLGLTPSARNWGERNLVLNTPSMLWFLDQFLSEETDLRKPDLSPLWADLSGLGPALFTVGTLDPLLDDSLFMSSRWSAAGNRAELAVFPGGVHTFDSSPTKLGKTALSNMYRFINSVLG